MLYPHVSDERKELPDKRWETRDEIFFIIFTERTQQQSNRATQQSNSRAKSNKASPQPPQQ
jgi:hypothetical protein